MRRLLVLVILLAAAFLHGSGAAPARAADLNATPPGPAVALDLPALRAELTRRAALYEIRAAFNVIAPEDIAGLLKADLAAMISGDADAAALAGDLLAEGSYYIVSLRYLVDFGGANWPADRPAANYERDARAMLHDLQDRWLAAVPSGDDLLAILTELDTINAWTEGLPKLRGDLDHFSAIPALVDKVIAASGLHAET